MTDTKKQLSAEQLPEGEPAGRRADQIRPSRWRLLLRWPLRLMLLTLVLLLGPLGVLALGQLDLETHWSAASLASSGQAPTAAEHPDALVQVYAARAFNWRGAFAVHTWIASKRAGASRYTVYQVIGWNLHRGRSVVTVSVGGPPDFLWYNAKPELLAEHSGASAAAMIDDIEQAVADWPYAFKYHVWPGPNSNSFTAFVARRVPALALDLPPTAIGKDYLADGDWIGPMPSGSGWQVSAGGLLGIGVAREEGIELNLLGLAFGIDFNDAALRLPGFGKVALLDWVRDADGMADGKPE